MLAGSIQRGREPAAITHEDIVALDLDLKEERDSAAGQLKQALESRNWMLTNAKAREVF